MSTTGKPNILFLLVDDVGVDAFRVDGPAGTVEVQLPGTGAYRLPAVEKLLANGVNFTRAWAEPVCSPTRSCIFSGLHPWRTGVGFAGGNDEMPKTLPGTSVQLETLADRLSAEGYKCGIFGKWHLGKDEDASVPTARGWHRQEGILDGGFKYCPQLRKDDSKANPGDIVDEAQLKKYDEAAHKDVTYWTWLKDLRDADNPSLNRTVHGKNPITPAERGDRDYGTADQVYGTRDWIVENQDKPWWATISLTTPHDPFHVPPAGTFTIQFKDPNNPTDQEMFVAMTESMDWYINELLNDGAIQDQLKNTVIVLAGDNGTQDELDGIKGDDKSSVYLGGAKVPLIITDGSALMGSAPFYLSQSNIKTDNDELVHVVDFYQTFIDIGDGTAPNYPNIPLHSNSMVPYLKDTSGDSRFSNWERHTHNFTQFYAPTVEQLKAAKVPLRIAKRGECAAITDGDYKLTYMNGFYEFAQLVMKNGMLTEEIIDDLSHPKAKALWQTLTDPNGRYYAEIRDPISKGEMLFPPRVDFRRDVSAIGSSNYQMARISVSFDREFVAVPTVVATPLQDPGWHGQIDDTFAVTITDITTRGFRAQVRRLDRPHGWGQNLHLEWDAVVDS